MASVVEHSNSRKETEEIHFSLCQIINELQKELVQFGEVNNSIQTSLKHEESYDISKMCAQSDLKYEKLQDRHLKLHHEIAIITKHLQLISAGKSAYNSREFSDTADVDLDIEITIADDNQQESKLGSRNNNEFIQTPSMSSTKTGHSILLSNARASKKTSQIATEKKISDDQEMENVKSMEKLRYSNHCQQRIIQSLILNQRYIVNAAKVDTQNMLNAFNKEITSMKTKISKKTANSMQQIINNLKNQSQQDIQDMHDENEHLTSELESIKAIDEQTKADCQKLKALCKEVVSQLQTEYDDLHIQYKEQAQNIEQLNMQIEEYETNSDGNHQMHKMHSRISIKNQTIQELENKLKQYEKEQQEKERTIKQLETEVQRNSENAMQKSAAKIPIKKYNQQFKIWKQNCKQDIDDFSSFLQQSIMEWNNITKKRNIIISSNSTQSIDFNNFNKMQQLEKEDDIIQKKRTSELRSNTISRVLSNNKEQRRHSRRRKSSKVDINDRRFSTVVAKNTHSRLSQALEQNNHFHAAVILQQAATHMHSKDYNIPLRNSSQKNTIMHFAIENNSIVLMKEMIKMKASPNIQNVNGNTPLHLLTVKFKLNQAHYITWFNMLLQQQAKIDKENKIDFTIKNKDGQTALELIGKDMKSSRTRLKLLNQVLHMLEDVVPKNQAVIVIGIKQLETLISEISF